MELTIEAEARALAMRYNSISLDEIIKWADGHIQSEENPNSNFFDLSLAKSSGEAISALNSFGAQNDKAKVAKLTFRFFYNSLQSGNGDFRRISKALFDMVSDGYVPYPDAEGDMWSFWDDLDLAIDGIVGDPEFIKSQMLEFIRKNMG